MKDFNVKYPMTRSAFFRRINEILLTSNASEEDKQRFMRKLQEAKDQHLCILITGPTGVGKSTLIAALMGSEKAKIGTGTRPETKGIEKYEFEGITIYDSPGFGDGSEQDKKHADELNELLRSTDENGKPLVDIVLVIGDASSRDIGTIINLINHLLIYHFRDEPERILVAINKADRALPVGNHWDYENNKPDDKLVERLNETCETIKDRIRESTGIDVSPIWICAGGKEPGGEKYPAYNISKLLNYIVSATPKEKRSVFLGNINTEEVDYVYDDGAFQYNEETTGQIWESTMGCALTGATIGALIGSFGGPVTAAIGAAIGAGLGRWFCSRFF